MIVLKQICQEYNVDPKDLRDACRKARIPKPKNRRWKWEDPEDPQLALVREVAASLGKR